MQRIFTSFAQFFNTKRICQILFVLWWFLSSRQWKQSRLILAEWRRKKYIILLKILTKRSVWDLLKNWPLGALTFHCHFSSTRREDDAHCFCEVLAVSELVSIQLHYLNLSYCCFCHCSKASYTRSFFGYISPVRYELLVKLNRMFFLKLILPQVSFFRREFLPNFFCNCFVVLRGSGVCFWLLLLQLLSLGWKSEFCNHRIKII